MKPESPRSNTLDMTPRQFAIGCGVVLATSVIPFGNTIFARKLHQEGIMHIPREKRTQIFIK